MFVGGLYLLRSTPILGVFDRQLGADARPLLGWPDGTTADFGIGLPVVAQQILCVLRTAAFVAFFVGYRPRAAGLLAVACGYLVLLERPFAFTATQHLLLQATMLLALADTTGALALRPEPPRSPDSGLAMMQAFVVSVYAWAALAKARSDWFDGRTLALFHEEGRLRGPLADLLLATPARCAAAGTLVFVGELSLVALLSIPRTRVLGVALAVTFHIALEWMGHPDVIGWVMISLLVVFLPVDAWPRESLGQP